MSVEGIRHADETAIDDAAGGNGDGGPDNSDSIRKVSMMRTVIEQRLRSQLNLRGETLMQDLAVRTMIDLNYRHIRGMTLATLDPVRSGFVIRL